MDWKENRHYFKDSTAYTWATSDCSSATHDNFGIQYATTTADNCTGWSAAITTYMTKAEFINHKLYTFYNGAYSTGYISGTTIASNIGYVSGTFEVRELTPEEKAAQEERDRVYAVEVKKADHKARLLFLKIAGKHRYRLLQKNKYFDIVGKTGQRYRLAVGEKVRVMKGCFGDEVLHKLCAYVPDVPAVDTLLAQYLALTSGVEGETEFAKIAIKHAA